LALATGSVGPYLLDQKDEVNTFFSRDAGMTWYEVAKGEYVYEFGDHGSVIAMAATQDPTNALLYTMNEGINWNKCLFSSDMVDVENIITDPKSTARNFLIQGSARKTWGAKSVLYFVDFQNYLEKQCTDSDYELWSPSDVKGETDACILGQKYSYTRKKREAACWNDRDLEPVKIISTCTCKAEDYECDYCFVLNDQKKCEFYCSDHSTLQEPDVCPPGDFWYRTRGYRKISDDLCIDTNETMALYAPIRTECGKPLTTSNPITTGGGGSGLSGGAIFGIIVLVLLFLFIFAVIGLIVAARTNPQVAELLNTHLPASLSVLWDSRTGFRRKEEAAGTKYEQLGLGTGSSLLGDDDDDGDDLQDEPEEVSDKKLSSAEKGTGSGSSGSGSKSENKSNVVSDDDSFNPRAL